MMIRSRLLLVAFAIAAVGCAKPRTIHHVADSCPVPSGVQGFPVVARSDGGVVEVERLSSVARAVAGSWPSSGKSGDTSTTRQLLAALAYEAGSDAYDVFPRRGWTPAIGDTATVVLSYSAGAPAPTFALQAGRDTTRFQRMALAAVVSAHRGAIRGVPQRDTLPLQVEVASAGAPVIVRLHFGAEPGPADGVARFTVTERDVVPIAATLRVPYPESERARSRQGSVRVSFGVRPDGTADLSTLHVHKATTEEFARAVIQQVGQFRFRPAERNCRPVFQLVQQPVEFRLGGVAARAR